MILMHVAQGLPRLRIAIASNGNVFLDRDATVVRQDVPRRAAGFIDSLELVHMNC
ncbi:MAG: hypothetical protein JWN86_1895 [Planctomycetota bacterium]|nr:hypothetical protein [Planctomycetota bacterium]